MAKPGDIEIVARLCRRAVGPDDYVLTNLAQTIAKKRLFLTFSRESRDLIGMSNFDLAFDGSGWLSMARTDPEWRGQGVAQFLQRCIANYAKERGIRSLRFFVSSTNQPSLRAARKGGFKKIAECSHISLMLKQISGSFKKSTPDWVDFKDNPGDYHSLIHSKFVLKMHGYLRYGHAFVKVSNKDLKIIKNRGKLFQKGDSIFVLVKTDQNEGEFAPVSGKTRKLLLSVIGAALEMKLEYLGGFIPYDRSMIRTALSMGFKRDEWGRRLILFERNL